MTLINIFRMCCPGQIVVVFPSMTREIPRIVFMSTEYSNETSQQIQNNNCVILVKLLFF